VAGTNPGTADTTGPTPSTAIPPASTAPAAPTTSVQPSRSPDPGGPSELAAPLVSGSRRPVDRSAGRNPAVVVFAAVLVLGMAAALGEVGVRRLRL